jgi:uncharacterized membrane protein YgaE (UPF0421/DUF939 family)
MKAADRSNPSGEKRIDRLKYGQHIEGLQLATRASISGGIALATATWLGLAFPIFAFIAAVVVTDLSPAQSRQLGWRQIIGTIIGAICGLALSNWLPQSIWAASLGVMLAMALCHFFNAHSGARIAGFTCGVIIVTSPEAAWQYGVFRMVETLLGVSVAWLVTWLPRLVRT